MHSYLPEMGLSHVRHGCIGCFCCVASCEGLRGSSPPNSINIYFPAIVRSSFRVASLILYIVRNSVKVDVITYGRPSSCSNPLFFFSRIGTVFQPMSPCCFHGLLGFSFSVLLLYCYMYVF